MRVSTKARYAVAAMADLAQLTEQKQVKTVVLNDVAERQELPMAYLEQLFAKLRKAGLVRSMRGAYGGYTLSRPSEDICIADIIYAVDAPVKATRCENHSPNGCMSSGKRCLSHHLWEGLDTLVHQYFSQISLKEISLESSAPFSYIFNTTPAIETGAHVL